MAITYKGLSHDGYMLKSHSLSVGYCWADRRHEGYDTEFQCQSIDFRVYGTFTAQDRLHLCYTQTGNGTVWTVTNDTVTTDFDAKSDYEPQYYKFYRDEMVEFIRQWLEVHSKNGYRLNDVQSISTRWYSSSQATARATIEQEFTENLHDIELLLS